MFRLQIVLTFVVILAIVVATSYATHRSGLTEAMTQDAEESLRRAATVAELEHVVEVSSLRSKAEFVAHGKDLADAITKIYEPVVEDQAPPVKNTSREALHNRHLKVHERLLRYQKEFELYEQREGKTKKNIDLELQWRRPMINDLFFAVDTSGVALAALGKDLFSWNGNDVAKTQPLIQAVLDDGRTRTGIIRWSFEQNVGLNQRALYLVSIAPIRLLQGGDVVGAVVVGNLINDGMAQRHKTLYAGVAEQDLPDAEVTRVLKSAPDIVYFQGSKVLASSFDPGVQKTIGHALFKGAKLLELEGTEKVTTLEDVDGVSYLVRARLLPRQKKSKEPTGFAVLTNVKHALKPLEGPGRLTLIVGMLGGFVAVVLLLVFIQLFLKPLADLEHGMQEVIAGHKDHEFTAPKSNKAAVGLAQQLNLMSAFLQNKRMPDADDEGGGWGDLSGGAGPPKGGSRVQGVSMQDLMGKRPKDNSDQG